MSGTEPKKIKRGQHVVSARESSSADCSESVVCVASQQWEVQGGHDPRTVQSGSIVNGSGGVQRVATEGSPQDLTCDLQDTLLSHPSVNHDLHLNIGDRCCVTLCGRCGQHQAAV